MWKRIHNEHHDQITDKMLIMQLMSQSYNEILIFCFRNFIITCYVAIN